MNRTFISLLVSATVAAGSILPAAAGPLVVPTVQAGAPVQLAEADGNPAFWRWKRNHGQDGHHGNGGIIPKYNDRSRGMDDHGRHDDWRRDNDHRYSSWHGYRGYSYERPGYRRHSDGFWYPLAAFAVIGGLLATQVPAAPVAVPAPNGHVAWCQNRYRSYRAYDNTFQPYNGPRQVCVSPYS